MKTCPVCQKFVTDQAKFCYYCGASLLNVAPDAPAPAPEVEQNPAEEIVAPLADAVEEPVEPTAEGPVEPVEEPVAEAIEEFAAPVEEAVEEPAAEGIEEAAEEPVVEAIEEAVEEPAPVEPVVEPVAAPIPEPVAAPVVTPVTPVSEPVIQKEAPVQAPVVQPVVNATDSRSLMTTAGYIFTTILFHIPIVGLIFMIVWGCGKPKNISRKRFSLAMLILRLLGVIAYLLFVVLMLIFFSEKIPGWYHSIIG